MQENIVHFPLIWLVVVVSVFLGVGYLLLRWLLSNSRGVSYSDSEKERDWTLPSVDAYAHLDSLFHRWDPRIKIASLVIYFFCLSSITQPIWAFLSLVIAVVSVRVARIPFRNALKRLSAITLFLGMFLLVMPLTVELKSGDTAVVFEPLSFLVFNLRGVRAAILIICKAAAIALMMEPLIGTSPLPVTVQALRRLRVPQELCQMILLAHRYVYVFYHEMKRMTVGMAVRGFRGQTKIETLRVIGNFVGMLLVKSFERTQRVYDAMLARGYRGVLSKDIPFQSRQRDWVMGLFWVCLGVILLGLDHWVTVGVLNL